MRSDALDGYLSHIHSLARDGATPATLLSSIAAVLCDEFGLREPLEIGDGAADVIPGVEPPRELCTPWLLGWVHEALLDDTTRRRAGAHYTPAAVARALVDFASEDHDVGAPVVCDPAVGGGAFLLAAAERLHAAGLSRERIVRELCWGIDVDPLAASVARASLALWAGVDAPELDEHIVASDALLDHRWPQRFDLVVGNPPFQNQLERDTARAAEYRDQLRDCFGDAASGYVDSAALFLLRSLRLVRRGGRVALVQPHSTLVARDATPTRRRVLDEARIVGVWFADDSVFHASVRVWAPVLDTSGAHRDGDPIARRLGADFATVGCGEPSVDQLRRSWGPLVADLAGVPHVTVKTNGRVGDVATATAGFRDQFYGLVGAVDEHDDADDGSDAWRLITSGLIDVLRHNWGRAPARFARTRYSRPIVRLDRLEGSLAAWVRAQLVPKVLVATQSRVVEAVADPTGAFIPSTPVIAVHVPRERVWHLAAALSAPPVSALALSATFGAALATGALKLSAKQVLELPLPSDLGAWDRMASLAQQVAANDGAARATHLAEFATVACEAYGAHDDRLVRWWLERIC